MQIVLVGVDQYYGYGHRFNIGVPVEVKEGVATELLEQRDGNGRQVFCRADELGPADVTLKLKNPSEFFFDGKLHLSGAMVANVPKKLANFYLRKNKGRQPLFEIVENINTENQQ